MTRCGRSKTLWIVSGCFRCINQLWKLFQWSLTGRHWWSLFTVRTFSPAHVRTSEVWWMSLIMRRWKSIVTKTLSLFGFFFFWTSHVRWDQSNSSFTHMLPWCRVTLIIPSSPPPSPHNLTGSLEFRPASLADIFPMFVNCVLLFSTTCTPHLPQLHSCGFPLPAVPSCLPCSSVLSNSH